MKIKGIIALISLFAILIINLTGIVYANPVAIERPTITTYSASYYISIIVAIVIVTGTSILILRKIYKDNKLEEKNDGEVEGKND